MIADESSETELKLLIQFFGLDSSVMKWRYHPEKNFLCLYKPVKFCLSRNKGSTRDVSSLDYDEELIERYPQLKIWRKAYHDQMVKMYQKTRKISRNVVDAVNLLREKITRST